MNLVPIVVENEQNGERSYDLYSKLLASRIVFINGEINDSVASTVIAELLYLDSLSNDDISIYINSPGGMVTAGFAIYDTMNFIKSDVSTIGMGLCASMAAFLLSSGQKGKRYLLPNAEVMIHQPLGAFEGQASDIEISAKRILKQKEKLNKLLSKNTNQPLSKIITDTDRDYFLEPNEALVYGIIDEII